MSHSFHFNTRLPHGVQVHRIVLSVVFFLLTTSASLGGRNGPLADEGLVLADFKVSYLTVSSGDEHLASINFGEQKCSVLYSSSSFISRDNVVPTRGSISLTMAEGSHSSSAIDVEVQLNPPVRPSDVFGLRAVTQILPIPTIEGDYTYLADSTYLRDTVFRHCTLSVKKEDWFKYFARVSNNQRRAAVGFIVEWALSVMPHYWGWHKRCIGCSLLIEQVREPAADCARDARDCAALWEVLFSENQEMIDRRTKGGTGWSD